MKLYDFQVKFLAIIAKSINLAIIISQKQVKKMNDESIEMIEEQEYQNDTNQIIFPWIPTSHCQDQYIQQFLSQGVLTSNSLQFSEQSSQSQIKKQKQSKIVQIEVVDRIKRCKSRFHNYQKHLIITLRKNIKISKFSNEKINEATRQLWKCFMQSKIYNKSLLRILFGQNMIEEELNPNLFEKQGFRCLVEKYDHDQIIMAQHQLKKIVLVNFQSMSLDSILMSKKLPQQTKNLFKKYIKQFIEELKAGTVMKRLSKIRKTQILLSK